MQVPLNRLHWDPIFSSAIQGPDRKEPKGRIEFNWSTRADLERHAEKPDSKNHGNTRPLLGTRIGQIPAATSLEELNGQKMPIPDIRGRFPVLRWTIHCRHRTAALSIARGRIRDFFGREWPNRITL